MFILIAFVNRYNFGFDDEMPPWRKNLTFSSNPKIQPILWNSDQPPIKESFPREVLLWSYMARTYETRTLKPQLDSLDFQEIFFEERGDTVTLHLFGEKYPPASEDRSIDRLNSELKVLTQMIQNGDLSIKNIVCDFSKVKFINSEGLSHFITLNKILRPLGGNIKFTGVSKQLQEVLQITKLDLIFGMELKELSYEFTHSDKQSLIIELNKDKYNTAEVQILSKQILRLLNSSYNPRNIIIDCSGVKFIDETFIGVIKQMKEILSQRVGGNLAIFGVESLRETQFGDQLSLLDIESDNVMLVNEF